MQTMKRPLYAVLVLALALALAVPLVGCDSEELTGSNQAITLTTRTIYVDNVPPSVTGGTEHDFCSEDPEEWDEWHFVINDLEPTETAPEYMTAVFEVVGEVVIPLEKVSGGVAHYRLEGAYLDATLLEGYAELDENATYNRFNLSHAPCEGVVGPQATLTVVKFFDGNANGVLDVGEPLLDNWCFAIDGALYSTPFGGIVDAGVHNITELLPDEPNWVASNITVDGTESYTVKSSTEVEVTLEEYDDVAIYFGNYCLVPSGGFTPGYWSQVVMSKGPNPEPIGSRRISDELYDGFVDYITNMNPVTLVNNDGSPASFSDALTLSQWIGSGLDAVNMAAQLSRHTAAMILNILSGAVYGTAYYIPAEMTVQEIVNAAKALLNANPIIIEPGELRDQAEQLKDWLDELNNGADVVPPEPCPYTFTL